MRGSCFLATHAAPKTQAENKRSLFLFLSLSSRNKRAPRKVEKCLFSLNSPFASSHSGFGRATRSVLDLER